MEQIDLKKWTKYPQLISWIKEMIALCQPKNVHLCDGFEKEFEQATDRIKKEGEKEEALFSLEQDFAEMKEKLDNCFAGSMIGKTMYVVPFCIGPMHLSISQYGIQITDSIDLVYQIKKMAHIGNSAIDAMKQDYLTLLHVEKCNKSDSELPKIAVFHFPNERKIFSFAKSPFSWIKKLLPTLSFIGKKRDFLAENMSLISLKISEEKKKYFAIKFAGKTQKHFFSALENFSNELSIEKVSDSIGFLQKKDDGKLYATHPNAKEAVRISSVLLVEDNMGFSPLISEALSWNLGVLYGASMASLDASKEEVGKIVHDPFSMRNFVGYPLSEYLEQWFMLANSEPSSELPKFFSLHLSEKENLKEDLESAIRWLVDRVDQKVRARITPVGYIPTDDSFELDRKEALADIFELEKYFSLFGNKCPKRLNLELNKMKLRILQDEAHYSKSQKSQSYR